MNRTKSYVCTLDPKSTSDMEKLAEIRKTVSTSNKVLSYTYAPRLRVTVRGRRPIEKSVFYNRITGKTAYTGYTSGGGIVGGLANASSLDVYIHEVR